MHIAYQHSSIPYHIARIVCQTKLHHIRPKLAKQKMLTLRLGRNWNAVGATFKCEYSATVQEQGHSVLLPGWEIMWKVHCYVQVRRMLYFCPGRNTNGGSWALIHSASFLPSSSPACNPSILSLAALQPFQSSSSRSFLCMLISRLPFYVFCICVLTYEYQQCN